MNFLCFNRDIQELIYSKIGNFIVRENLNTCLPEKLKFKPTTLDETVEMFRQKFKIRQIKNSGNYTYIEIPFNVGYENILILNQKYKYCKMNCRCYDRVNEIKKYKYKYDRLSHHIISNMNVM